MTNVYQRDKFEPALASYRAGTLDQFNLDNPDALVDVVAEAEKEVNIYDQAEGAGAEAEEAE